MTRVLIAAFSSDYTAPVPFIESLVGLWSYMPVGIEIGYKHFTRTIIHVARRRAADLALAEAYDALLMIDDDQTFPPDALERLLAHDADVVSALAYQRVPPHEPCVFHWALGDGVLYWSKIPEPRGLTRCDATGFPFTLIKTDVFRKLDGDWFKWHSKADPSQESGEDVYFCFPAGTWIHGPRITKIEDVKSNARVMNHSGFTQRVTQTMSRKYTGKMVRIKATYGFDFLSTPEHPVLAKTYAYTGHEWDVSVKQFGSDIPVKRKVRHKAAYKGWVPSGEIKKGDWIYIPKPRRIYKPWYRWPLSHFISTKSLMKDTGGNLGYTRTRKSALKVPSILTITPGFCRLIGYYIAEGSTPAKRQHVSFTFGFHEDPLISDCVAELKAAFPGIHAAIDKRPKEGVTRITVSSRVLARLLTALCGSDSYSKKLPRPWYRLDDRCLKEMIKGLWWGDGSHDISSNHFSITTSSERLAHEVQHALLRLGLLGGIHHGINNFGNVYWSIRIPAPMTSKFAEIVGYPIPSPTFRTGYLRETKRHFLVKVRKVQRVDFDGDVYNMEVRGAHTYNVNGVAVHNCARARDNDILVHVDTSLVVGHLAPPAVVTEETYVAYKQDQVKKALETGGFH